MVFFVIKEGKINDGKNHLVLYLCVQLSCQAAEGQFPCWSKCPCVEEAEITLIGWPPFLFFRLKEAIFKAVQGESDVLANWLVLPHHLQLNRETPMCLIFHPTKVSLQLFSSLTLNYFLHFLDCWQDYSVMVN